ncbi:histidine phosphatase family protein [Bifidobacterium pullorum subsp. saeculare]|uniref:Histidine phosphatase family protein n=1 Tax=Bifidobacterium pullorum subsp. saeculare TaxID=78257 RepID=A0A938WWT7_9BIFI|nr:histidine phosphatase family protein [Bifidobacterium pullorum]MBM6699361.1 histidine phosphatase family protein [Bifidobacterium pullorum subsp. saeculare]
MDVNPGKITKRTKAYKHILLVMRHAKAEASNAGGDRARELTDKGLKQAKTVAKGLKAMKLVPDAIVCSAATRAQQTCAKMLKTFGDKPTVDYHQSLYDAGVQAVFDELAHAKEKTRVMLVLGHEPTVSIASQWLASPDSNPAMLDLLNLGLGTAGVVVFGSDKPFASWQVRDADLIAVMRAKDFD